MNQFFHNLITDTDDPFNFVAFSAQQIEETLPFLRTTISFLIDFYVTYTYEIHIAFLIFGALVTAFVVYLLFQTSSNLKRHRKIHAHHYMGFGEVEDNTTETK